MRNIFKVGGRRYRGREMRKCFQDKWKMEVRNGSEDGGMKGGIEIVSKRCVKEGNVRIGRKEVKGRRMEGSTDFCVQLYNPPLRVHYMNYQNHNRCTLFPSPCVWCLKHNVPGVGCTVHIRSAANFLTMNKMHSKTHTHQCHTLTFLYLLDQRKTRSLRFISKRQKTSEFPDKSCISSSSPSEAPQTRVIHSNTHHCYLFLLPKRLFFSLKPSRCFLRGSWWMKDLPGLPFNQTQPRLASKVQSF